MGEQTKIAWADHTFNPWIGCQKVHTGCDHCYAETYGTRFGVQWGPNGTRRKTSASYWKQPRKWNRQTEKAGVRYRVFPSLCDPFEDRPDLEPIRREFFDLIDRTPNLDWLLLTKRPENIRRMWQVYIEEFQHGDCHDGEYSECIEQRESVYRHNVFLLYSASDQQTLDVGLPHLLACRDLVPVLGLSLEPLIGPIDIALALGMAGVEDVAAHLDWVIVGGESGPKARPCDVAWIRSVCDQCATAAVPAFAKQLGANVIWSTTISLGVKWMKPAKFTDPKGGDPDEWPADMRVREMPRRAAGGKE